MSASGSRRYIVTDRVTGETVKNCFVLRPDLDDTAIEAIQTYQHRTPDKNLAQLLDDWMCKVIREKYKEKK